MSISPASVLELNLPGVPVDASFVLMVSVRICFGRPINGSLRVVQMDDVGAAKVLAVR